LALFTGKTVQASFDIARQALKAAPYVPDSVLEGEKFILLPESSTPLESQSELRSISASIHDKPIFQSKLVSEWTTSEFVKMGSNCNAPPSMTLSGPLSTTQRYFDGISGSSGSFFGSCNSSLPPPPPDFEGREVDMYKILTMLLSRRLVSLVGPAGVGKTAITTSLCTYIADRGMFQDGVFYMKVSGLTTHNAYLAALLRGLFSGPPRVFERMHSIRASSPTFMAATSSITTISPTNMANTTNLSPINNSDYVDSMSVGNNGGMTATCNTNETVFQQEEFIVTCLTSLNVLLVMDHLDDLLYGPNDAGTDLKFFLGRLFDRCQQVKVLVTCTQSLGMKHISGFGVVENSIFLGPLTLRNSVRLYARLASSLLTSAAKSAFIAALLPPRQHNVMSNSKSITQTSVEILQLFGNGHPAAIVKLACESTPESVESLIQAGMRIRSQSSQQSSTPPVQYYSSPQSPAFSDYEDR
jgi:hypothetical protein